MKLVELGDDEETTSTQPTLRVRLGDQTVTDVHFTEVPVSQGLSEFLCTLETPKGRIEGLGLSPIMALDDAIKSFFYTE